MNTDEHRWTQIFGASSRSTVRQKGHQSFSSGLLCPEVFVACANFVTRQRLGRSRFPNLLYRRFPNRRGRATGRGWRVWKPTIQQTWKSALRRSRLGRAKFIPGKIPMLRFLGKYWSLRGKQQRFAPAQFQTSGGSRLPSARTDLPRRSNAIEIAFRAQGVLADARPNASGAGTSPSCPVL